MASFTVKNNLDSALSCYPYGPTLQPGESATLELMVDHPIAIKSVKASTPPLTLTAGSFPSDADIASAIRDFQQGKWTGLLAKLDADTGVIDTNYKALLNV